jgi:hypothetical protein
LTFQEVQKDLGLSVFAGRERMRQAGPLHRVQVPTGKAGRSDARWFTTEELADAYVAAQAAAKLAQTQADKASDYRVAKPRTITPCFGPPAKLPTVSGTSIRCGSLDFREFPSRRGDTLFYRDGRTEKVA